MSIKIIFIILFLINSFNCLYSKSTSESQEINSKASLIYCDEPEWSWGNVLEGKCIEHSFVIENKGNKDLRISGIKSGCSCTAVEFSKKISPGEKGNVTIKLRTVGRINQIQKRIYVYSNDPQNKKFLLTMSGVVKPIFTFTPAIAVLQGLRGEELNMKVQIKHNIEEEVEIKKIRSKRLEYKLETIESEKEYELSLYLKNPLKEDYAQETIKLVCNVYGQNIEIPFRVTIRQFRTINSYPSMIVFHQVQRKKFEEQKKNLVSRQFVLKGWKGKQFGITDIEVKHNNFAYWTKDKTKNISPIRVFAKMNEKKSQHIIRTEMIPFEKIKGRPGSSTIIVHTDDKKTPVLKIPVKIYRPQNSNLNLVSNTNSNHKHHSEKNSLDLSSEAEKKIDKKISKDTKASMKDKIRKALKR